MKQPPIVFSSEWVLVALAQETHVVSVLKLLQGDGVTPELAKVFFYRALIFIAPVNQLFFFLPLNLLRNARRLNGEGKQHDSHEKHDGEQDVASLVRGCIVHHCHPAARVREMIFFMLSS